MLAWQFQIRKKMHDRIAINHLCFMRDPVSAFAAHLDNLGAKRASLVGPLLFDDSNLEAARSLVASGHVRLETITHPFQSGRQISSDEADWSAPRAALSRLIDIAAELGAQSIYMVTGGAGGLEWEDAARCFAEAIAPCVEQSERAGVQLMVETTNPFLADLHIAHSLADTIKLADIAGIGVCLDLYACWTGSDMKSLIGEAVKKCRAVQFSDYAFGDRTVPDRAVPGDGGIPLERLVGWVLDAGYTGCFDMELGGPRIAREGELAAARRSADYMTELLDRLGA